MTTLYHLKDGPFLAWEKLNTSYSDKTNTYIVRKRNGAWAIDCNYRTLTESAIGETDTFKGSQYIQRRTLRAIKEVAETHFRLRLLQYLEPVQSPSVASGS